ncbi:MAG: methyltransferase domain-containing protein, partial [Acidimicrobiales bacterium]|nr:methyltransferase domain-containing protein [Acidimicrobiales bacterium]
SRNERVAADDAAAAAIGRNRNELHLPDVLTELAIAPLDGLSLACGAGRHERSLLAHGVCDSFHGIDVAHDALATAREEASAAGLAITYSHGDLNDLVLEEDRFDLVVARGCLHHVLRLEHLADQIATTLRPGGVLWVDDYVGETQFQYDDERLEVVNYLLALLPERYRYDVVNQRLVEQVHRREPGNLSSPFESIRSGDILDVFLDRFEVVAGHQYRSVLHLVPPVGTYETFRETDTGRTLFEMFVLLDQLFVDLGVLRPVRCQYLLRPA